MLLLRPVLLASILPVSAFHNTRNNGPSFRKMVSTFMVQPSKREPFVPVGNEIVPLADTITPAERIMPQRSSKSGDNNGINLLLSSGSIAGALAYWRQERTGGSPNVDSSAMNAAGSNTEKKETVENSMAAKAEDSSAMNAAGSNTEKKETVENSMAAKAEEYVPSVALEGSTLSSPRSIKLTKALKLVKEGQMKKRDFVSSRIYRLARKINPGTECDSEESCELELDSADPTLIEMAEDGLY